MGPCGAVGPLLSPPPRWLSTPSAGLSEESRSPAFPFPTPMGLVGKEGHPLSFSFQSDCVSLAPERKE